MDIHFAIRYIIFLDSARNVPGSKCIYVVDVIAKKHGTVLTLKNLQFLFQNVAN